MTRPLLDPIHPRGGLQDFIDTISRRRLDEGRDLLIRPAPPAPAPRLSSQLIWLAGALGLLACLLATVSLAASAPGTARSWWMYAVASALLLAGALGLCFLSSKRSYRLVAAASGPVLGFAAGLTVPLPTGPSRSSVAVVAGCTVAVVVLALARTRYATTSPGDRTVMAALGCVGLLVGIGTVMKWPAQSIAAIVTGVLPLAIRLLPSASLTVDPNQLIDTTRLATTIWSVRERDDGEREPVTRAMMQDRFDTAREIVAIGTAYLSVALSVSGWFVATSRVTEPIERWAGLAVILAAALAVGYQSRSVRDRLARYSMQAACGSLVFSATVALLRSGWGGAVLLVVFAGSVLAWVCVMVSDVLDAGFRSTRMSRFADWIESTAIVLALPLGIVAAGGIEALRRVTSG